MKKCDNCGSTDVKIKQFSPDSDYFYFCNEKCYYEFKEKGAIYRALDPEWIETGKNVELKSFIDRIVFSGERVVPNKTCHPLTMAEHLIRYSLATKYAKVGKILDVACGTGYGLKIMGMLGAELFGADISEEAIKTAEIINRLMPGHILKIDFEKEALNYSSDFGLITSFETIEHLENPNLLLKGILGAIQENGKFIYSIPLANPSKYHKVVYTFESALELINTYFEHEEIYIQESLELVNFSRVNCNLNDLNKRGIFLIGVCHKKKI